MAQMHLAEKANGDGFVEKAETQHIAPTATDGHFSSSFNPVSEPLTHFDKKQEDKLYRKIDGKLLWILALLGQR
jgi:hypothetical protein